MNAIRKLALLAGAAGFSVQAMPAAAQQSDCITEPELAAMVTYAMPSLIAAAQVSCGPEVSAGGFLSNGSAGLAEEYRALQPVAWPQAKSSVIRIVSEKAGDDAEAIGMIAGLPDEALSPFVDALIVQEVSKEIPLKHCGKIERIMEAIAPIEPAAASNLVAVIFALVDEDDEEPWLCRD